MMTVLPSWTIYLQISSMNRALYAVSVFARTRFDQRRVHRFKFESWFIGVGSEVGFGRFKKVQIVTFGELRFVVRASGLVAQCSTLSNHARELQHVVKLAREDKRCIRPHLFVA